MENKINNAVDWYSEKRPLYEKYCREIVAILEGIFEDNKVTYIDITSRAKTIESFTEKCKKDKYIDPVNEIHDFSGLRITAYTNSEVEKITDVLCEEFIIDKSNSSDKKKEMEVDRFGYLSVHFVASLKDEYLKIPKYKKYEGLKFEIQVRTLLQHVWSEIEHDRNYKFKGALPKELKRRFYMIAGVLELVDKEFDLLTDDITKYTNDIENRVASGELNIELSDTSILSYLNEKFKYIKFKGNCDDVLILEMKRNGLESILDLNTVINNINKKDLSMIENYYTNDGSIIGFIRDILILSNSDLYFSQWSQNWNLSLEDVEYFEKYNIDIRHYSELYDIELDETECLTDEEIEELRN